MIIRQRVLVALTVLGAGCAAHGAAAVRDPITEPFPTEQAQVKQVIAEILDAVKSKDLGRLESLHSYTPKFSKFEDDGLGRQDADAGRQGERGIVEAKGVALTIDDLEVDVFGTAAVATGILDFTMELGADKVSGKDRITLVFVNDHGAWKIVHEHASPLSQPAAPAP